MMENNEKNIIIGVAYGYDFDKIKYFIDSLVLLKYSGKVVVVGNKNMIIPVEYLNIIDLEIVYDDRFKKDLIDRGINKVLSSKLLRPFTKRILLYLFNNNKSLFYKSFIYIYHVVIARFAFYHEFFYKNIYKDIFITDIRDVFFQKNIFEKYEKGVHVFNEQELLTISQCPWNSTWIRDEFGVNELNKIGKESIFCVGTIRMDYLNSLKFLDNYIINMLNSKGPMNIYGPDTAIFNYMIHNKLIENVIEHSNGDTVLTVTHETFDLISINNNCIKYREYFPSVIHQYDRHDALNKYVHQLF
ncbi:hypothetical protein FY528_06125 [Hymenobacter lutimineralis]|uniref:Uncharacterized protein n=1 Tax=Hymenobacter lutimineralis TaxID=2606448 RepID=A0A5D6V9L6_9BACT|nr:hypothetical protein [Hymenobacter lutimineralis]TYZ11925.1 hypothetical protein FY528_06125 [Hymenobacter lutimineralis]